MFSLERTKKALQRAPNRPRILRTDSASSLSVLRSLSYKDRNYVLQEQIKQKEARIVWLQSQEKRLEGFLKNLDTPLLMDPLSAKYDPEALRVITQNEFLRRKIEEL